MSRVPLDIGGRVGVCRGVGAPGCGAVPPGNSDFGVLRYNRWGMTISKKIIVALQKDDRLVVDGKLAKNKVIELALQLDSDLIKSLRSSKDLEKIFFQKVDDVLVFDKVKFQSFVSNKQFLPDSFTEYKNKIGLISDGHYITESNEVVLAFPYKDCILEGGQTKEEAKRKEVFWNETLAPDEIDKLLEPKVLTNLKRYDNAGESIPVIISPKDNLIIKGNNLLALHTIKKNYRGKVKLIYIDPPYNTGSDSFQYNDNFSHTTWLVFMKNRLAVAKDLLNDDGIILVHCDYIEDEIFGRENFVNTLSIRDSHPSGLKLSAKETTIIKTKSTILVYKKKNLLIKPVYQRRSEWDKHFSLFVETESKNLERYSLLDYLKINNVVEVGFKIDENSLQNKRFRNFVFENRNKIFQSTKEIPESGKKLSLDNPDSVVEYNKGEYALNGRRLSPLSKSIQDVGFDGYKQEDFGKLLCDFWDDVDFNNSQGEGGVSLPAGKKPEFLLARLITMFTNKGDLILDYYLGSGTTASVAHKMGRKFIGIEQLDYGENDPMVRLKNVIQGDKTGISQEIEWKGGGSFIYAELAKANQLFVEKIQDAKNTKELLKVWDGMKKTAFLSYKVKPEEIDSSKKEFEALSFEDQQRFLVSILDKNLLYVPYSEIDDKEYSISKEDKELNKKFYGDK